MLTVLQGDCRDTLSTLPAQSVQCCVTSPPYFGLRAYLPADHPDKAREIGQEKTPQEFVKTLVGVFEQVRRVLRDDGVLFVNLADSHVGGKGQSGSQGAEHQEARNKNQRILNRGYQTLGGKLQTRPTDDREMLRMANLKPKDLCLVPQRFVISMQEQGWYVRDQIAWVKRAPMPESVKDRFTKAWEPIFMFTKSPRYYFDVDAVKEPAITASTITRDRETTKLNNTPGLTRMNGLVANNYEMRQMRNAWILSPETVNVAHFATYPTEIPRRCILAASRTGDTVLDPFSGSGTTGKVALELGRKAVLCELNPDYVTLIEKRTTVTIGFNFEVSP